MNTELWQKIKDFDLDHPLSEYGFSTRLANENFWTKNFTEESVLEYKKFMYLAATSEFMVSPSEIVDTVWHEHLIFTQSYQDFCNLIGKQVQHIPSTHNKEEAAKFAQAKLRTRKLYTEAFGVPPVSIWEYPDIYASLNLPKAKIKLTTFSLIGVFVFLVLIVPFYFLLKPIYITLDNPEFLFGFAALTALVLASLELYNRKKLSQIVNEFDKSSFVFNLQPLELVYLNTGKLSGSVNGVMNEMVEKNKINIHNNYTLSNNGTPLPDSPEEYQTIEVIRNSKKQSYPNILRQLMLKPIFMNTANAMDAFKKYFLKSSKFGALYYLSFCSLAMLSMFGLIRLSTGVVRGKPVGFMFIMLILLIIISYLFLARLKRLPFNTTVPDFYRDKILFTKQIEKSWRWDYFLMGNAVLVGSFMPVVNHEDRRKDSGGSDVSGGGSCGSSCGSSCSSCGGCGGD